MKMADELKRRKLLLLSISWGPERMCVPLTGQFDFCEESGVLCCKCTACCLFCGMFKVIQPVKAE